MKLKWMSRGQDIEQSIKLIGTVTLLAGLYVTIGWISWYFVFQKLGRNELAIPLVLCYFFSVVLGLISAIYDKYYHKDKDFLIGWIYWTLACFFLLIVLLTVWDAVNSILLF